LIDCDGEFFIITLNTAESPSKTVSSALTERFALGGVSDIEGVSVPRLGLKRFLVKRFVGRGNK
jgi:hypothetical protein